MKKAKHRGETIRNLRKIGKVSLQEVAPRVGLAVSTLGLIERGLSDLSDEQYQQMDSVIRSIVRERARKLGVA